MGLFGGGDSTSTTNNLSQTQTQDRRTVTGTGSGAVNADNSSVILDVVNNATDGGAVAAAIAAAQSTVGASAHFADVGAGMVQSSNTLAASMANGNNAVVRDLAAGNNSMSLSMFNSVVGMAQGVLRQSQAVDQTAQTLALAPMTQQNPDRYLLLGALAIVAVVGFMAVEKH